ncbi:hypothetical protein QE152_g12523 [Popillia japonica]|uniref:Uncharacterized protein n=1 Tax=Popillia japonica TaxID=7064 RepID=A0AAW1LRK3_POPJA
MSHRSADCAHKSKELNTFGHKAHNCKSKTANQDSSIKSLSVTTNNMHHKQIGIGNITVNALIDTVVDDDTFFIKIFVAPNGTMNIDAVIGQELLRQAEMKSSIDNITICKLMKEPAIMTIEMTNLDESITVLKMQSSEYEKWC